MAFAPRIGHRLDAFISRSLYSPSSHSVIRAAHQSISTNKAQSIEMATPYTPQDVPAVSRLISALETARKDKRHGGFSCRKSTFDIKSSPDGIKVDSWRMQDWDYKRKGLPTYARGLFTTKASGNTPEIAIRGYDKFFNVNEVNETKWEEIFQRTRGPYELTLKENGCIIFVAGLEDDTLLVCSKHSTGDRSDVELSHARAGEIRLEKQLAAIGKTKEDLARELRSRNVTAVAELCDDSFEEHILAYEEDKAGLYLHGINLNLPEFATYPSHLVQEFAGQWGFIKTDLLLMEDPNDVKAFLDDVAKTGAYAGRDVEGFVIRCKMSHNPAELPYQDWFFKYKFEEPYLMYRQWRECTKAVISGKQPKFRKHVRITEEYLLYARRRLAADPKLSKHYNQNHGIIKLRDDFLAYKNMKGSDAANLDALDRVVMTEVTRDVILTPIATLGCGKTTLALALAHLFNWGHIQNDNISGKGRPPRFVKAVMDQLKDHAVVFADRNNAQKHERKQLIGDVKAQAAAARIVCLNFRHDEESIDEIRRVTQERVIERGDNHQTIHAATDRDKYIEVMEGFIKRFEECSPNSVPDAGFDLIIDLDPTVGTRENLETVVNELNLSLPNVVKEVPSPEKLDEAIQYALGYTPDFKHTIPDRGGRKGAKTAQQQQQQQQQQQPKKRGLEYMSIDVPTDRIDKVLEKAFKGVGPEKSRFFLQLKNSRRVQRKFHVTLMHKATMDQQPELWKRYTELHEAAGGGDAKLGECDLILERVIFDDRIMAIVVRIADEENKWVCVNRVAHITVGTRDPAVKPKESNDLLAKWLEVGTGGDGNQIAEVVFEEKPTIKGVVKGVLSR
ncbi:trna ligase [Trichoderma cornu-damae]|uniref:tRNA ligase n=1 Tax=Trichoderma cornu-damae TaxID=654480 RepID=A0A9P8QW68_9HYPO|nr:trna ligase [Trichoderma cornu-damae]